MAQRVEQEPQGTQSTQPTGRLSDLYNQLRGTQRQAMPGRQEEQPEQAQTSQAQLNDGRQRTGERAPEGFLEHFGIELMRGAGDIAGASGFNPDPDKFFLQNVAEQPLQFLGSVPLGIAASIPSGMGHIAEAASGMNLQDVSDQGTISELAQGGQAAAGLNALVDIGGLGFGGSGRLLSGVGSMIPGVRNVVRSLPRAGQGVFGPGARQLASDTLSEAGEEAFQQAMEETAYGWTDDSWSRIGESAGYGGLGGLVMGATGSVLNRAANESRPDAQEFRPNEATDVTWANRLNADRTQYNPSRTPQAILAEMDERIRGREDFNAAGSPTIAEDPTRTIGLDQADLGADFTSRVWMQGEKAQDILMDYLNVDRSRRDELTKLFTDRQTNQITGKQLADTLNQYLAGAEPAAAMSKAPFTSPVVGYSMKLRQFVPGNVFYGHPAVLKALGADQDTDISEWVFDQDITNQGLPSQNLANLDYERFGFKKEYDDSEKTAVRQMARQLGISDTITEKFLDANMDTYQLEQVLAELVKTGQLDSFINSYNTVMIDQMGFRGQLEEAIKDRDEIIKRWPTKIASIVQSSPGQVTGTSFPELVAFLQKPLTSVTGEINDLMLRVPQSIYYNAQRHQEIKTIIDGMTFSAEMTPESQRAVLLASLMHITELGAGDPMDSISGLLDYYIYEVMQKQVQNGRKLGTNGTSIEEFINNVRPAINELYKAHDDAITQFISTTGDRETQLTSMTRGTISEEHAASEIQNLFARVASGDRLGDWFVNAETDSDLTVEFAMRRDYLTRGVISTLERSGPEAQGFWHGIYSTLGKSDSAVASALDKTISEIARYTNVLTDNGRISLQEIRDYNPTVLTDMMTTLQVLTEAYGADTMIVNSLVDFDSWIASEHGRMLLSGNEDSIKNASLSVKLLKDYSNVAVFMQQIGDNPMSQAELNTLEYLYMLEANKSYIHKFIAAEIQHQIADGENKPQSHLLDILSDLSYPGGYARKEQRVQEVFEPSGIIIDNVLATVMNGANVTTESGLRTRLGTANVNYARAQALSNNRNREIIKELDNATRNAADPKAAEHMVENIHMLWQNPIGTNDRDMVPAMIVQSAEWTKELIDKGRDNAIGSVAFGALSTSIGEGMTSVSSQLTNRTADTMTIGEFWKDKRAVARILSTGRDLDGNVVEQEVILDDGRRETLTRQRIYEWAGAGTVGPDSTPTWSQMRMLLEKNPALVTWIPQTQYTPMVLNGSVVAQNRQVKNIFDSLEDAKTLVGNGTELNRRRIKSAVSQNLSNLAGYYPIVSFAIRDIEQGFITPGLLSKRALDAHDKIVDTTIKLAALSIEDKVKAKEWLRNNILSEANAEIARLLSTMREVTARMRIGTDEIAANQMNAALRSFFMREDLRNPEVNVDSFIKDSIAGFELAFLAQRVMGINSMDMMFSDLRARIGEENLTDSQILERLHIQDFVKSQTNVIIEASDTPEQMKQKIRDILDRGYYTRAPENAYDLASRAIDEAEDLAPIRAKWNSILFEYHINRAMNNYTVMVQNNPVPLDTAYDIYSYWEYAIDMVQDEVAGLQLNWDSYRDPFSQVKFPNLYLGNRNNLNLAEASKASAVSAGIAIRVGLEGAAFKDFGGLLTLDHTRSLQPPSQSQVTINDIKSARWDNNLTQYEGWRATASDGTTFIINETTLEQRADDEQVTLSSPEYSSFGDIINPAVQNVYNTASEAGILQAKKYFDPFKLIAKGIENKQANNRDITADPINGIMHARKDIAMAYVDFWNQYEGVSQKTRRDADALALLSTLLVKVEMNNHPPVAVSYEIVFRGELDQHIKDLYDGDQVTKISTMVEPVAVVTRRLESAFIKAIDSGAKQADAFKAANDALTDGSGIVFNTDEGVNDIIMGIESVAKPTMSTLMTEGQPNKFQRFFASVNEGYHEQLASVRREIATDLNQQQQERMAQVASMLGIPGVRISAVFSDRDPNMGDADVVRELNDISKNYPKNKRNGVGSVALVWTDNASTFFDNVENRKAIGDQNVLVIEHNGSLRGEDYFSHAAFVSNMEEARFPMTLWDPVQAQLQQEYYNLVQTQRNIPQSSEEYGAFFIEENAAFFARGDSSSFFTEDFGKRNYITQDFSQSIDLKLNRNWGRGVPSLVSLEELINMDRSVIQLPMISEGTEWAEPLDTEDKRNAARESLEVWVKDAMKDMSTIKNRPAFNTSMARGNVLGVLRYPQNVDTDQPVYVALVPTTGVTTYSVDVQDVQIVNGEQVEITAYHTDNLWNFGHIKMTDGQIKTYTGALENEYADGLPQPENLVTSGVVAPDLGKPARVFSYNILAENLWGASRIYPCSALLEWDGSKWMLKNDLYQRLVATNLFTEEEIAKFPEGNTTQNKVWREYKAGRLQLFGTDTDRAMRSLILRCEQNRVNITEIISPVVMQAGEPRSNRTAPEMGAVILKSMNEDDLKLIYETLMPNWAKYFGKNGEVPLRGGSGEFGRFRITRWSELSETNELTINPSGQRAHAFQREIMMGLVTHPSHLSDRMINHFRDHINTPSYQAVDTSVPLKVDPDNPILTRDVTRELAAYMADPLYAGKMAAAREYVGDIRRKWYQHYNIMDGERTVDTNKLQGLTNMMNEAFEFTTPITTEQMLNHFVKPEDGWSPFDSKQATMPWPRLDMIVKGLISRLNTDGSPLFSASVYENGNQKRFSIPFTTAKGLQLLETSPVFRQKYTNKQTGKYDVELFKNDIRQNFELFKDNINHNVQDRKQNETLIKMVDFYDSELNIGLGNMLIGLTDPVSMFAQEDTFHATLAPQFPFMDIKQLQDLNEEAHQRMLRHNKAVMDKDRIWLESSVKRTGKSSMAKQGKHTMANKAFQTLGDMTQIAGLAQGLQLPISNLVSRRLGTFGLDVMHQLSSKTGIGPKQYGKDLNPQIARDISRTAIIQKIIWLKKQSSFLAVDLAQLLNEVTTIEELNARIDEIVRGMSPAQKILYKVGNYANFGNMGTSWQAEIFLKQFAKNLSIDPVLGPMYNYQMPDINGEPNVEGYTFLEASLMDERQLPKLLAKALLPQQGDPLYLHGQRAFELALEGDMAHKTVVTDFYSYVAMESPARRFFSASLITRFPQYSFNLLGKWIPGTSTVHHLFAEWATSTEREGENRITKKIRDFAELRNWKEISTQNILMEAVMADMMKLTPLAIAWVFLMIPGAVEPPEDEEKWINYDEWTFFGFRVSESWWMNDILGPVLPIIAAAKSAQLGRPNMEIFTRGFANVVWSNPLLRVADWAQILSDPEEFLYGQEINSGQWDKIRGGVEPTEVLTAKMTAFGMNWLEKLFYPGVLTDAYRNWLALSGEELTSAKMVEMRDERGDIVLDADGNPIYEYTTYADAMMRYNTRYNLVYAFLANAMHGFEGTGYAYHEMPTLYTYDEVEFQNMHHYSVFDYEAGDYKSIQDAEATGMEIISLLMSTDDMEQLRADGFVLDGYTRKYVSTQIAQIRAELQAQYNYQSQTNGFDYYYWGEGDYNAGVKAVSEYKEAFFADMDYWKNIYSKLWSDELRQPIQAYNYRYTTYNMDANGEIYVTGFTPQTLLPFMFAPDELGRAMNWETESVRYPERSAGDRALIPVGTARVDVPGIDDWGEEVAALNAAQDEVYGSNRTGLPSYSNNRYSGGGGGGGGGGYRPSIYSRVPSTSNFTPRTMNVANTYNTQFDYLRPEYEVKGSREASKRQDI